MRPRAGTGGRRQWTLVVVGIMVAMLLPALVVQHRVNGFGWDDYAYVGPLYYVGPDRTPDALRHGDYDVRTTRGRRPTHDHKHVLVYRDGRRGTTGC